MILLTPQYKPFMLISVILSIMMVSAVISHARAGYLNSTLSDASEQERVKEEARHPYLPLVYNTQKVDTTRWSPPRFQERRNERHQMVRSQIKPRGITNQQVVEAMRHVPRHLFVPDSRAEVAYEDRPLPIGNGQTISQPFIVAYMTQGLNIDSTDRVLEIGTGSGYQAAILSEITPEVYTIEIVEPLARQARRRFEQLGYETIKTKIGNGYNGWAKFAPYDAIIVTAAPDQIPGALKEQLRPGGTMIIPVGAIHETQKLLRVRKKADGTISKDTLLPVRFVPMTGEEN